MQIDIVAVNFFELVLYILIDSTRPFSSPCEI